MTMKKRIDPEHEISNLGAGGDTLALSSLFGEKDEPRGRAGRQDPIGGQQ